MMLMVPRHIFAEYMNVLKIHEIPMEFHVHYVKWLRYYLDFCSKYVVTSDNDERIDLFLEKLKEKRQSEVKCEQAAHAVRLYHGMKKKAKEQAGAPCHAPIMAHVGKENC